VLRYDTDILEEHLNPEDGGSKVLRNVGTYRNTTQRNKPEDLDLKGTVQMFCIRQILAKNVNIMEHCISYS